MENKSDLKSLYFVLFVLLVIETVMFLFFGFAMAIAVLIVALIIQSRYPKYIKTPEALKLTLIISVIHISTLFTDFISIYFFPFIFFNFFFHIGIFVTLIITCIKIYQVYSRL